MDESIIENTIVIIDDDKMITDRLVRFLNKEGFTAIGAYSGAEGLKLIENNKVDLVITDMKMGDIDGLEVLRRIKEKNKEIGVVMISGYPTIELAVEAMKLGAYDYIQKPINIDELLLLIKRYLGEKRLAMELNTEKKLRQELERVNKELLEKQEQLIRAEKLASIGQLAAGIAHEINNPLTAITMNICSVLDLYERVSKEINISPEIHEKFIKKMRIVESEADRAAKIVKSLLMLSRKSKDQTEREECNINEIILDTLAPIEHQLQLSNIKIINNFEPNLPIVNVNKDQMQQVFLNLINNAKDAMPNGGSIEISTRTVNDEKTNKKFIEISFSDTGIGIPEENLNKIFDPFYTTKDPGKGTGLGLSVTQSIILNHGGEIKVKSKVGSGTTFTIVLPVQSTSK